MSPICILLRYYASDKVNFQTWNECADNKKGLFGGCQNKPCVLK
jgi:hypothetical protein